MAKDKQKKKPAKPAKATKRSVKPARATKRSVKPASTRAPAAGRSRGSKVSKVAQKAGKKAANLAANPLVAEVVAATLVAAAAALRNPKKARDMAAAAAGELESASKATSKQGSALWQLALDVARRSIDSVGEAGATGKGKGKSKAKKKAKK